MSLEIIKVILFCYQINFCLSAKSRIIFTIIIDLLRIYTFFVLEFIVRSLNISLLSMLAIDFSLTSVPFWRSFLPFLIYLKIVSRKMLDFVTCFFWVYNIILLNCLILIFRLFLWQIILIDLECEINLITETFNSWDRIHLIMIYYCFKILLGLTCSTFATNCCIYI